MFASHDEKAFLTASQLVDETTIALIRFRAKLIAETKAGITEYDNNLEHILQLTKELHMALSSHTDSPILEGCHSDERIGPSPFKRPRLGEKKEELQTVWDLTKIGQLAALGYNSEGNFISILEDIDPNGAFINIQNCGESVVSLKDYVLTEFKSDVATSFKFNQNLKIGPEEIITLWSSGKEKEWKKAGEKGLKKFLEKNHWSDVIISKVKGWGNFMMKKNKWSDGERMIILSHLDTEISRLGVFIKRLAEEEFPPLYVCTSSQTVIHEETVAVECVTSSIRKGSIILETDLVGNFVRVINQGAEEVNLKNWEIVQWETSTLQKLNELKFHSRRLEEIGVSEIVAPGESITVWSCDLNAAMKSSSSIVELSGCRWADPASTRGFKTTLINAQQNVVFELSHNV